MMRLKSVVKCGAYSSAQAAKIFDSIPTSPTPELGCRAFRQATISSCVSRESVNDFLVPLAVLKKHWDSKCFLIYVMHCDVGRKLKISVIVAK